MVRKKRVHMEEEGNSLLLRFEDRETETARRYPKEKKEKDTLIKGRVRGTRKESR